MNETRQPVQRNKARLHRITISKGLSRAQEPFAKEIRVPAALVSSHVGLPISFLLRSKS